MSLPSPSVPRYLHPLRVLACAVLGVMAVPGEAAARMIDTVAWVAGDHGGAGATRTAAARAKRGKHGSEHKRVGHPGAGARPHPARPAHRRASRPSPAMRRVHDHRRLFLRHSSTFC